MIDEVGTITKACEIAGINRQLYYKSQNELPPAAARKERVKTSPRALSLEERHEVLRILTTDEFVDKSPEAIFATLLDRGIYYCSARTMYRILNANSLVKERRKIAKHPKAPMPSLKATEPNQVWTWDCTKLRGTRKGEYFYLYVMIDIYSRYVVGWMVANHENAGLAEDFIQEIHSREKIKPDTLIIHSDRGAAMTSKTLKQLYDELHIERSLSRPRVSNDNPFVESHFKLVKYRPNYPKNFQCILDARLYCVDFFDWYNKEHRHSGISYMAPYMVHSGKSEECKVKRQLVLDLRFALHPERFVNGKPNAASVPASVHINPPANVIQEPLQEQEVALAS